MSLTDYVRDLTISDKKLEINTELMSSEKKFTETYKDQVFITWYKSGKPGHRRLLRMLDADDNGRRPSEQTIVLWLKDFRDRGAALDDEVHFQLSQHLVAEKVEMLKRHADIAAKMQNKAIEYLETVGLDSGASAVRLLIESVRIERESLGVPQVIDKINKMSDQDLMNEFKKIVSRTPMEILPNE